MGKYSILTNNVDDCKYYFGKQKNNSGYFPESFRALIVGPSSAGKTALLMKILLTDNVLNYDKLYVFARSLYQPEYQVLKAGLENQLQKSQIIDLLNSEEILSKNKASIEETAEALADEDDLSGIECEFHNNSDEIPDPSEINRTIKNLIVFDDIMTDKNQTAPEHYYTRGRSANCNCIYLTQNYTHLPLHTIRSNTNYIICFKSAPNVVEHLHRTHAAVDMELPEFRNFCNTAWKEKYGYIVLDLSKDLDTGLKYRNKICF